MKMDFWSRNANIYDRFMKKDAAAYDVMCEQIRPVVKDKMVLELAAGTGLVAKRIVCAARSIEATDASPEMILLARKANHSCKLHFSVEDMFHLSYADGSFDVVIVSNALHIVPHPEEALTEIRRVLKDDGVLIAPTFTHARNSLRGKIKASLMKLVGFPLHSKWSSEEYITFLQSNGWTVRKSMVLKASFPLTYAECMKMEQKGRVRENE
ncbi:MAG: class I SAM-dependent methyltransferase [Eubacteriales bacterium]|nr:class I SAM-dependent methyltransferase [Eubacteriales bacterium]